MRRMVKGISFIVVLILMVTGFMNFLTKDLEQDVEHLEYGELSEYYVPKEESTVINLCFAGMYDGNASMDSMQSIFDQFDARFYSQTMLSPVLDGFDFVGLASRNAGSFSKEDIEEAYLQDILVSGVNTSTDGKLQIQREEFNEIQVAYLSFTTSLNKELDENQSYLVNVYHEEESIPLVEKAASMSDVVVVSMDWNGLTMDEMRGIAKKLADAGTSVIVGMQETSIQPVEWIDDTLVYYSLGNLASKQDGIIGGIGAVTITKNALLNGNTIVELTNPKVSFVRQEKGTLRIESESDAHVAIVQSLDDSIRVGGIE